MLAAFPSPVQAGAQEKRRRGSWFPTSSWPLAPSRLRDIDEVDSAASTGPSRLQQMSRAGDSTMDNGSNGGGSDEKKKKKKRGCCCGIPRWGIFLLVLIALAIVAVAVVVPLQVFVFKTLGDTEAGKDADTAGASDTCASQLTCQNGGTLYSSSGTCSCICTNGFTGRTCSESGSEGCTTTNLVGADASSSISNVTLGTAIPRLVEDASANFSIPLSPSKILAKINAGDLSCRAQNSLVTFQGRSARTGQSSTSVSNLNVGKDGVAGDSKSRRRRHWHRRRASSGSGSESGSGSDSVNYGAYFSATENTLDFARVAVLYVLQEESASAASDAQAALEGFFSQAARRRETNRQAGNVTLGEGNRANLLTLRVDVGEGYVGG